MDDRWDNNDLVIREEASSTSSFTAASSTSSMHGFHNGIKPLPVPQNRIPKLAKSSVESSNTTKEQDLAEKEKLRSQLTSLQALLEKTSKKGGDILRSFKGRDVMQNQTYVENAKLQTDVEKRIEEVKGKLFEICRRLGANKEVKKVDDGDSLEPVDVALKPFAGVSHFEEEDEICDKNFIDPGMHWCKQCDIFLNDLTSYLKHMTTEKHWKVSETKDEPWRKPDKMKFEVEPDKKKNEEIKGVHTLVAVRGFFCQVCGVLLGSPLHAEDHLKTNRHSRCYNRQKLMNGQHEYNYSIDKSRALTKFQSQERKRLKEQEEKEEREKEAKRRAVELEMKKRSIKEKLDEEIRLKKSRESQEKMAKSRDSLNNQDRDRDRDLPSTSIIRDRERERERDRDRDRDRERYKDREREKLGKSSSKYNSHKERERVKEIKSRIKHSDEVRSDNKVKHSTVIEKIEDENVFGPQWPFGDSKLAMKSKVIIPKKEWQICYRKHIKLMMQKKLPSMSKSTIALQQKLKQEAEDQQKQEKSQSSTDELKSKLNSLQNKLPPQSTEPEDVDSSIGDLVLAITTDRSGGMSDSDFDNQDAPSKSFKDMFTVEFDEEDVRSTKSKSSDFVVTDDGDFGKLNSGFMGDGGSMNGIILCDPDHQFEALGDDEQMDVENGHDVFLSDTRKSSPIDEDEDDPFKSEKQQSNRNLNKDSIDSITLPTDEQMLSPPPIWTQPLSLHDLADC